jgi:hypothetical protein
MEAKREGVYKEVDGSVGREPLMKKETKKLNQLGTPSSEPKRSNFTKGTIKVSRMKLESASSNIAYEVRQII